MNEYCYRCPFPAHCCCLFWGLKRLYKNKFSRRWQYYIWIIAALRFLLPFTPDTTIVGSLFERFDAIAAKNETLTSPNTAAPENADNDETELVHQSRQYNSIGHQSPESVI